MFLKNQKLLDISSYVPEVHLSVPNSQNKQILYDHGINKPYNTHTETLLSKLHICIQSQLKSKYSFNKNHSIENYNLNVQLAKSTSLYILSNN